MNKKAILAIIVLMSAALVGIALIQGYWVTRSVQLNREKFDKDIFEALNEVAERIRRREVNNALERLPQNQDDISILERPSFSKVQLEGDISRMSNTPLAERIDLPALEAYLRQEMNNRGIKLEYNYGVYSTMSRSFVILDDYFVFEEDLPDVVHTGINKGLFETPYRVELFKDPDKLVAPGILMIYFPKVTRAVWESVWQILAGSFLFTAIIMFCFAYTIQVIFRQKKLSEMRTDFINNMTHEFKTPIATISLAADSITTPMISENKEKVVRFAEIIKQENKRMLSQVEKVLQIAQIEKDELKLNYSDVIIHPLIIQAVEHINLQVERKDGKIICELNAQNDQIWGDPTHISNMIHNLLDNANKYSPEKPEIIVRTRNISQGIEIEISDKGIGISKEQRKLIFDKFYRVHTGNLHDVKGFGLGLSYVKAMVTAHKGYVDVKSEIGKGSSFTLFFPFNYKLNGDNSA
jgi:two-component system phosphate regulon sensor histidine kinase PhoR